MKRLKKLLMIGMCFALVACAGKLQTAAGPVDFEITPGMVDMIFDIATKAARGPGDQIRIVMIGEKRVAIIKDGIEADLKAWGNAAAAITYSEAIFIKGRSAQLKKDYVFRNAQGTRFKIIHKAQKTPL